VLAILFVVRELRAPQPMLPLSLFKHRLFALTSLVGLLVNVAFYGLIFVFSLYFQRVNGLSPFAAGLAFLPSRTAALGTSLPFAGLAWKAAAQSTDIVARRVFFDNPDYGSVRVSPDGQTLAFLAPIDGVRNLWVAPVADPGAARPVTHATDRNLASYYRWAHTSRHLVFFQERDGDENWRASSVDIASGVIVPLTPPQGVKSFVQELDHKFPEEMLLRHNARNKRYFDMFRVNLVTGKSELEFENNEHLGLITDSDFQLRLG